MADEGSHPKRNIPNAVNVRLQIRSSSVIHDIRARIENLLSATHCRGMKQHRTQIVFLCAPANTLHIPVHAHTYSCAISGSGSKTSCRAFALPACVHHQHAFAHASRRDTQSSPRPSLIYGRGRTSLHTRRWPPLAHSSPLGPPLRLSIRRAALPTAVPSIQSWPTLMPTVCNVRSAEASPAPHLHPRREAQDQRTHPPSVLGRPPVTPRTLWAS